MDGRLVDVEWAGYEPVGPFRKRFELVDDMAQLEP
jgi:hypothetical protein